MSVNFTSDDVVAASAALAKASQPERYAELARKLNLAIVDATDKFLAECARIVFPPFVIELCQECRGNTEVAQLMQVVTDDCRFIREVNTGIEKGGGRNEAVFFGPDRLFIGRLDFQWSNGGLTALASYNEELRQKAPLVPADAPALVGFLLAAATNPSLPSGMRGAASRHFSEVYKCTPAEFMCRNTLVEKDPTSGNGDGQKIGG